MASGARSKTCAVTTSEDGQIVDQVDLVETLRVYPDYACMVFNARRDKSKTPRLNTQVKLFREGREVFAGGVPPLDASVQTEVRRLVVARRLQLGTILEPPAAHLQAPT